MVLVCSFDVDLSKFPIISAINEACGLLPAFKKAHPDAQQ